ncbi:MAG: hypothetical protein KBC57_02860 [Neisseriaceae bacterium]|nr:hypothetical protein [Neisseriaceae bacterium]MBP6861278.1 hypothetical protein [Neisseriaceae bacterium]
MLNRSLKPVLAVWLLGSVAACGQQPEQASNPVLQQAVDEFLKEKSVCMPLALTEANGELSPGVQGMLGEPIIRVVLPATVEWSQTAAFKQMDALVQGGIYVPLIDDVLLGQPDGGVAAQVYQLTDEGRGYVYDSRFGDIFCMGHERVKQVVAREDDVEQTPNGHYLIHISYEPEFVMVPWAQALVAAGNQQLAKQIEPGQVSRTTLVYADEQWQDSRQFYKLNK